MYIRIAAASYSCQTGKLIAIKFVSTARIITMLLERVENYYKKNVSADRDGGE